MAITDENCIGGDLCLKEPGIRLPMRCGDVVVFPSHQLSHFNSHFVGERLSLVFHTDSTGDIWYQQRNFWANNVYMHAEQHF